MTPFFPRGRQNLVDLNSVTHRSQKTTELVYKPVMNLCSRRFFFLIDKSADDLHTNQDEKRYRHTDEKVQLKPEMVHQGSSKTKPPQEREETDRGRVIIISQRTWIKI
jgi:hypothetical protein